jgi:hypothetical protein
LGGEEDYAMVGPLIWLLLFDLAVVLVWWALTSLLGVTAPERLLKIMIGIVILINVIVIVLWALALFGLTPESLFQGPPLPRR